MFLDKEEKKFKPTYVKFFNTDNRTFFRVYSAIRNSKVYYFTFKQLPAGEYVMKEEPRSQIDEYIKRYDGANAYNIYKYTGKNTGITRA